MRVPRGADRDFVAGAFIVKEGEILFIRHEKHDVWLQPGGHVEDRETPDEAAIREAMEEVGLKVEILEEFRPEKSFENMSEDLPQPFNVNLHRIEDGHWHLDFQYIVKPVDGLNEQEYSDESIKWFSREELENKSLDTPENARKTALRALEKFG